MKVALSIGVLGLTGLLVFGGSQVLPLGAQTAQVDALSAQLETQRVHFSKQEVRLGAQIEAMTTEHASLTQRLAEADQFAATLKKERSTLSEENSKLAAKVTTLTGQVTKQAGELTQAAEAAKDLSAQLVKAGTTIEGLEQQTKTLRARAETLTGSSQDEITTLQKNIDAKIASFHAAKSQIAMLQEERADQAKALTAAEQRITAMAQKIEVQDAYVENHLTKLTRAETQVSDLSEALVKAQAAFEDKANALLINQLKVSVLRDELDGLKDQVSAQESYTAMLRADLTTTTQRAVMSCQAKTDGLLADNGISFRGGSSTISYDSEQILEQFAAIARECAESDLVLDIEGHTDDVGRRDSNLVLSMARANAVRDFLADRGVSVETMRAAGYGESDPIAENSTREGQLKNRRIVLDWDAPRPDLLPTKLTTN